MENLLANKIKQNITNFGPISIAEFMQNALFDHEYGYYVKADPFGLRGDFITAPEISQIFGEIIAAYIIFFWQKIGKPKKFQIIELGPGRASLMHDILRVIKRNHELYQIISIKLIELSPKLKKIQNEKLKNHKEKIEHHDNFSTIENSQSFIVANEFFDALPITQYQYQQGNWHERKISLDQDNQFVFILEKNLNKINLKSASLIAKNGDIYEICYPAINIMKDITRFLSKNNSAGLFIDYGYLNKEFGDSLQAIKKHKYHDIFHDIGKADITAHVDFAALSEIILKEQNLIVSLMTQRDFFINLGFKERSKILQQNQPEKIIKKLQDAEQRILAKEQMGDLFKVMLVEPKI